MANSTDNDDAFAPTMALDADEVAAMTASPADQPVSDATIPMSADEAEAMLRQLEAEQNKRTTSQEPAVESSPRVSSHGTPIANTVAERAIPVASPPPGAGASNQAGPAPGSTAPGRAPAAAPAPAPSSGGSAGLLVAAIVVVVLLIVAAIVVFAVLL